ncbi:uncharacterized protein LOC131952660 [Physella acuta]|uniref:uncharacterized protein LOC131952660 n=1 Tax=Physella acuta TaxID=109671 RepID=UPI0027DE8F37|nr:uncharacterized protein LOC131952660 [Physella acuta]
MYGISRLLLSSTSFPKTKVSADDTCRLPTVDAVVDLDPQGQESPSPSPTSTSPVPGYSEAHRAPKTKLLNCQHFFLKPSIAPLAVPLLPDVTGEKKSDVTEAISESEKWLEERYPYLPTSRRKRRIRRIRRVRRRHQTVRIVVADFCFQILDVAFCLCALCQFVIAVTYMHDCPALPLIPLCLLVFSLLTSANIAWELIQTWIITHLDYSSCLDDLMYGIEALLCVAQSFAFIAETLFTYSLHDFSTDVTSPNYCNPLLFGFAYGFVTVSLVFLILLSICGIIINCYLRCCATPRAITVHIAPRRRRELPRQPA